MMPPPSGMGGGHGGTGGADRPDSSGLLGGVKKPWEAGSPPPLSDPGGIKPPAVKPEDWAAPPAASNTGNNAQLPQAPQTPMMPPPSGMGGGQGGSNAERPDSSGLLGGEKKPWEGAKPPALDLSQVPPPPSLKPEDWATGGDSGGATPPGVQVPLGGLPPTSGLNEVPPAADLANPPGTPSVTQPGQQVPAGGMPPMMPPGTGGQPGAGAERPDSSGLLGGVNEPWTGSGDSGQVGGTSDVVAPSSNPESWAITPAEQEEAPVVPVVADDTWEPALPPVAEDQVTATPVVPAEVDLTPAAAPAGWTASSGVVPAVQDGPSVTATAAVLGASAVTAAAALGSTVPRGSEFPHVDADGKVKDDEDRGGALLPGGGATGPLPGVDSVVVVRPDDAVKDTSAWDTGGMDFLLPGLVMPLVVAKSDKSGWDTEEPKPDVELEETPLWENEPSLAHTTYRRRRAGEEGPTVVDSFVAPPSCGDEFTVPPDEREEYLAAEAARAERLERESEEGEDAEPEERTAADLLNEKDSAWGGSKGSKPTGVLE
jgi:hypothetical protein